MPSRPSRAQPPACLVPQASGAPSFPSTRPAAPCSRARTPASSASSTRGQHPSASSGELGTKNWRVSRGRGVGGGGEDSGGRCEGVIPAVGGAKAERGTKLSM